MLIVAAALAGCAAMQNTLAQDLAWERWNKCNHFRGITLKEIKTDGQIWVWVADGGEQTAWRDCDRKVAAEQGQRQVTSAATVVATSHGSTAITRPIAQPVWKVGNEWAYRYESPSGTGTFVWRLDRIENLANGSHYVITTGTREIFYREADHGFTKETLDGKTIRAISPSAWRWVAFPLSVGVSWDMKYVETRPTELQTENIERRCVAEGEETLTVPAGTFATIRIVCNNTRNNAWVATVWYSPEVNHMVRDEYVVRAGGRAKRELLMFRLK